MARPATTTLAACILALSGCVTTPDPPPEEPSWWGEDAVGVEVVAAFAEKHDARLALRAAQEARGPTWELWVALGRARLRAERAYDAWRCQRIREGVRR